MQSLISFSFSYFQVQTTSNCNDCVVLDRSNWLSFDRRIHCKSASVISPHSTTNKHQCHFRSSHRIEDDTLSSLRLPSSFPLDNKQSHAESRKEKKKEREETVQCQESPSWVDKCLCCNSRSVTVVVKVCINGCRSSKVEDICV